VSCVWRSVDGSFETASEMFVSSDANARKTASDELIRRRIEPSVSASVFVSCP
jgi:hypothetical protein